MAARCHIALLRAVNVGGTGKLPMADLRALAESLGFTKVRTLLASGNLLLDSPLPAAAVRARLEQALGSVQVVMRSPAELQAALDANPFPEAAGNRLLISFLNEALPADAAAGIRHQGEERIHFAPREVYVHYGEGMGASKLRIPAAEAGTARNLNTVRKLVEAAA
jgi:uncharacterized protein (DUF1697 family)